MESSGIIGKDLRYTSSAYGTPFYASLPLGAQPWVLPLEQSMTRSDIDQQIDKHRHWLETTSLDHAQRVSHLHNLGMMQVEKFHLINSFDAIDLAIESLQEAINIASSESPARPLQYLCLAVAYHFRCERHMNTADIDSTIRLCHEAAFLMGTSHHLRGIKMKILGDAYRMRLNCSGEVADINESIRIYKEALDLDLPSNIIRVDLTHALGLGYQARYQVTATMWDMDTSLQLLKETCDATAGPYQMETARRRDLALGHQIKYLRNKDPLDIDTAITLFQECVDHTPTGDPILATCYANLGTAYKAKHRKAGSFDDLERSIKMLQHAVDISGILADLKTAYNDKFYKTKVLSDIDTAIEIWQQAIDSSDTKKQQATHLQWKSRAALERFNKTKSVTDINQSISFMQQSLKNTLLTDIPLACRLYELGNRYRVKYKITRDEADLIAGTAHLWTVIQNPSMDVYTRILAGEDAMSFFALADDWKQGYEVADSLMKLIPSLVPRFLEAFDVQYVLRDIEGMACEAASMALNAGKEPLTALQALETGRDVMATSIDDLRGEVDILKRKHPDLANEFLSLRTALDLPATKDNDPDQRYEQGNAFEILVDKIRQQPGFEGFLGPPSEDALKLAASEHPIVVINVSEYSSDAIIVLKDRMLSLAVPDLSYVKIKAQSRHRDTISSPAVLSWLWDVAMKPILDFLRFTKIPVSDEEWPRVCWIPTGPLSGFPLHAAGYHANGSSEAVIERVMSPYSSSVKAIINGRQDTKTTREVTGDISLLVAMETTPGATTLPFATREVNMLHRLHKSMLLDPIICKNKVDILSQLPNCKVFHSLVTVSQTARILPKAIYFSKMMAKLTLWKSESC
ncbi:hypothetical protein FGSG_00104 [Fusarium graminearum PH-1]|uniref:hypothetical protein n=1 Tax=Gibberella zeae (strain ATCC MYA-4620 / CBS 123657 / FGSC 9075 / NRRL 31084 / PH-1) TaxID=229533 RepID=UPI00021F25EB|nr:hypothetical protein FGSG_00104 [Fusarium graminearum PH-1]ESU05219.1 hypothetical protein FGSG_00104 [Fusarium graminearum PH-1]|eukprot:XP_011315704.1 hypothetical protein FGSG_00104 [Fusarium graminearum PH-1]